MSELILESRRIMEEGMVKGREVWCSLLKTLNIVLALLKC